jgi:hypothetical protein
MPPRRRYQSDAKLSSHSTVPTSLRDHLSLGAINSVVFYGTMNALHRSSEREPIPPEDACQPDRFAVRAHAPGTSTHDGRGNGGGQRS